MSLSKKFLEIAIAEATPLVVAATVKYGPKAAKGIKDNAPDAFDAVKDKTGDAVDTVKDSVDAAKAAAPRAARALKAKLFRK